MLVSPGYHQSQPGSIGKPCSGPDYPEVYIQKAIPTQLPEHPKAVMQVSSACRSAEHQPLNIVFLHGPSGIVPGGFGLGKLHST